MGAKLSVNINKIALLRNSRLGNHPDLYQYAQDCEEFGAEGITVHPRPDERHVRYADIPVLKNQTKTEFNIEGNPNPKFLKMVLETKPHQCTLVPDSPDALTSDQGWDTKKNTSFLKDICDQLRENGIRSSIFLDPDLEMLEYAKEVGVDRIELYTGDYAKYQFQDTKLFEKELAKHADIAKRSSAMGIGVNAGHDLNLDNLKIYAEALPTLLEVSIGHALTVDALYYGIKNVIGMYKNLLS